METQGPVVVEDYIIIDYNLIPWSWAAQWP